MSKIKISKELTNYIEKALKKGHSEEVIRHKLREAGHQDHVINHHLKHLHNKKKYGVSIVVFSLIVIIVFFLVLANNQETVQQPVPDALLENPGQGPVRC